MSHIGVGFDFWKKNGSARVMDIGNSSFINFKHFLQSPNKRKQSDCAEPASACIEPVLRSARLINKRGRGPGCRNASLDMSNIKYHIVKIQI